MLMMQYDPILFLEWRKGRFSLVPLLAHSLELSSSTSHNDTDVSAVEDCSRINAQGCTEFQAEKPRYRMVDSKAEAEALIPLFRLDKVLNQDQKGSRLSLLGSINGSSALLLLERAAFPSDSSEIIALLSSIVDISNLGANDIYRWYMGNTSSSTVASSGKSQPSLKINLIYPCTASHIKKYTPSRLRMVTETPEIYVKYTHPYLKSLRDAGKLNWIFNILEGRAEQEDVIMRNSDPTDGFLLAPDLNWDRKTLTSLHLLALVERRDIWSLRDLTKEHVDWLKHMREALINAATKCYPDIDEDELKLYIHCKTSSFLCDIG